MATLTSSAATSSPRPSSAPFCGGRSGSGWPRTQRRPSSSSSSGQGGGCGRPLDRVAGWVGGGIAAAFFASLERCSCVNVRTDDDLDDEQRDSVAPLMLDDGNGDPVGRRGRGGSRRGDKDRRSGGAGCYGDFNV